MKVNTDLGVFVAVAESEGFSAAARRLGVSKAMVSVAIARLEDRLGVRLLQRSTRRMSLTEAGVATLPHAQRSLQAARDAEEAATQAHLSPRGLLKVNAPMSFGLLHVAPALHEFAAANPEVRVDLVLDDRLLDLVEGGFDLAVRIGALPDSGLFAHKLCDSRMVIAAHKSYLKRRRAPRTPAELAAHPALIYTLSATGARWTLTRAGRSETVRVAGPLQANSSLALQQALLDGLGVARIPRFIAWRELARGQLVQLLPDWELPQLPVHVVTTARDLPRKTRAFLEFLRARIGTPPYWEGEYHRGHEVRVAGRGRRMRRRRG